MTEKEIRLNYYGMEMSFFFKPVRIVPRLSQGAWDQVYEYTSTPLQRSRCVCFAEKLELS